MPNKAPTKEWYASTIVELSAQETPNLNMIHGYAVALAKLCLRENEGWTSTLATRTEQKEQSDDL